MKISAIVILLVCSLLLIGCPRVSIEYMTSEGARLSYENTRESQTITGFTLIKSENKIEVTLEGAKSDMTATMETINNIVDKIE